MVRTSIKRKFFFKANLPTLPESQPPPLSRATVTLSPSASLYSRLAITPLTKTSSEDFFSRRHKSVMFPSVGLQHVRYGNAAFRFFRH